MKHIYANVILILLVCTTTITGKAQSTTETKTSWFKNKVEVGGNFAFNVGNRTGIVELSPTFSLRPIPKLVTSLGLICQYSWDNKYSTSRFSYGAGLSAQYNIIDNMYVYCQYTYNPYILIDNLTDSRTHGTTVGLWVGGGYTKRVNEHIILHTGIIYNVLAGPHADDNPRISGGISYQL